MPKPKKGLPEGFIEQDVDTSPHPLTITVEQAQEAKEPKEAKYKQPQLKKKAITVHIPPELVERARNAVYYTPGLTFAELAERGIRGAIEALEANRGSAFPERNGELPTGRPVR